jgi:major membrane immunogen (membrane-anchored lipoprotein)
VSIEITDRTQGIWYVTIPDGDWMGHIEAQDGGRVKVLYRFRYYKGPEIWDSKDVRNWYSAEADDLTKAVEVMRVVTQKLKASGGGESWEVLRGSGSVNQFFEEFKRLPFVHVKKVSKDEYEARK